MALFDDFGKKMQAAAGVAAQKAQEVASIATEKAQEVAGNAKNSVAIMNEQRELDKNYKAIGEWFVSEHGDLVPEAVADIVNAINESKKRIAELEAANAEKASAANKEAPAEAAVKTCPNCGASAATAFCPQCGTPLK